MNVSFHSPASPTAIAVTRDTICGSNTPSHLMAVGPAAFSSMHEGKGEAVGPTSKDSESAPAVHPMELLREVEATHGGRPAAEELPKRPTACRATPTPNAVATAVLSAAAASYGPLSDGGGAAAAAAIASIGTFWATVGLTRRFHQGVLSKNNAATAHGEGISCNSSGAHRQRGQQQQQQQHRNNQTMAFASSARSTSVEVGGGGVQHGGGSRLGRQLSSAPSHSYARSRSISINPTPLLARSSSSLRTGGQRLRRRAASFAAADSSSSYLAFAPATDGLAASLPILPRRRVSIGHGFGEEHFERTRDASLLPYDDPSEALSVSVRLGRSGSRMFMFARMLSPASPTAAEGRAADASHVAAGSDQLTATSSSSKGDKQEQQQRGEGGNTASGAVRRGSAFPFFVSSVASNAALFARASAAAARTVFSVGSAAAGGAGAALRFAAHFPAMVGAGLERMRRGATAAVTAPPLDSAATRSPANASVSPPPPRGVEVDDEEADRFYNDSDCDSGDTDGKYPAARSDADTTAGAGERGSIRGEEGDGKVIDEFAYRRRLRQQFFSMSPAAVAASPLPANADTTSASSPPTTSANVVSGADALAETIPHPAASAFLRSVGKKKVAPSSFAFSPPTPSSSPTAAAADDTAGMGTLRMTEAERSLLLESPPSRGDDAIVRRAGSLMFVSPSTA